MFRSYCQVSIRCRVHTGEADSVEKRHNFLYMLRTIIDAIICDHTALHHNPWAKSDQLADFQLFSTIATFCVSENLVLFLVSKHVLTILNVSRGPFCSSPIAVVFQLPGWCLMVACLALAAGVGWQHGLPLQDQVPHRASPPGVFRPMAPWPLPAPWRPHGGTLSREKCQVWLDGRECQHPQQVGRTEQDVPCGPADADLKMDTKWDEVSVSDRIRWDLIMVSWVWSTSNNMGKGSGWSCLGMFGLGWGRRIAKTIGSVDAEHQV